MNRMLINASHAEELRVALIQNRTLYDFIVERRGFEQKTGNIYLARITSIEPSLDAIFVDFGSERHGFLPFKEISPEYYINPKKTDRPNVKDVLKVGQEILVQVEKEERGTKGAALTTFISLPGSFLVLMPNNPRSGGISRRIEGDDREQLRDLLSEIKVPEDMALIVRTAAIGRSLKEVQTDLDVLLKHWKAIKNETKNRSVPCLMHHEGNLVIRSIRDYMRDDIAEIIIDESSEFENAKHYLEQVRPEFADRLILHTDPTPLFSRFEIEHQIETAYKRTVQLPSGGSIVIDHTEALVSVDINSARATKGADIEETALNTNLEAAEEVARQLRLRDIGGLIVIDFIDMTPVRHQREVENAIHNALKLDRARIQIQRISRFGLLEMSRQRLRPSLREANQHVCPTCNGHGTVRSVESIALTFLRILEEEATKPQTAKIVMQAATDVSTYMLNEKRESIRALERTNNLKVVIIPNPNFQSSQYHKKRIRMSDDESGTGESSYEALEEPTVETRVGTQIPEKRITEEPAVKQRLHARPERSANGGLIKRLWTSMFGANGEETPAPTVKPSSTESTGKEQRKPHSRTTSHSSEKGRGADRGTRGTSSGRGRRQRTSSDRRSTDKRGTRSSTSSTSGGKSSSRSRQSRPSQTTYDTYQEYAKQPAEKPKAAAETPQVVKKQVEPPAKQPEISKKEPSAVKPVKTETKQPAKSTPSRPPKSTSSITSTGTVRTVNLDDLPKDDAPVIVRPTATQSEDQTKEKQAEKKAPAKEKEESSN